jgi:hypothetical protein
VVVSLTNTRHVNPLEGGHAGWCKQNFIELTGMTRARAAAASSCHACELAVRLVSRDCCACCGAATALRGCQWAAWRAVLPLAAVWHSALHRIWTGSDGFGQPTGYRSQLARNGGHSRPLETSRRAQGEGSVARRRSAGCQSVGFGRPG